MLSELWLPVAGAEMYEVSDEGRVRRNGKVLRQGTLPYGYKQVGFSILGVTSMRYVHRLILETFIGPAPKGFEADHIDRDPGNNRAENLRWVSHQTNARHRVRSPEAEERRRSIRTLHAMGFSLKANADAHGTNYKNLWALLHG